MFDLVQVTCLWQINVSITWELIMSIWSCFKLEQYIFVGGNLFFVSSCRDIGTCNFKVFVDFCEKNIQ